MTSLEHEVMGYLRRTLWFPEFCVRHFDDESLETVAGRRRDELLAGGAIALRHGRLIGTALDAGQSKSGRLSS